MNFNKAMEIVTTNINEMDKEELDILKTYLNSEELLNSYIKRKENLKEEERMEEEKNNKNYQIYLIFGQLSLSGQEAIKNYIEYSINKQKEAENWQIIGNTEKL